MELIELKKRLDSIIDKAYQGGVTLLPFLDEEKIMYVTNVMSNHPTLYLYSNGGIINSQRNRIVISPYDTFNNDFKIVIFKVLYNKKYYEINHRSTLGSLMGLGIKRECIGDIVITSSKDVFIAITEEMSSFVKNELRQIGKAQIDLIEYKNEVINEIKYETKTCFIQSLRLDSVVADAISKSRSEAQEHIFNGLVMLNYNVCQNNSESIKEGDILSIRHYGKYLVSHVGGKSKSGRIVVEISKRI